MDDRFVMPLILYYNDSEGNNPLKSLAGCYKLGDIYFSLSAVPPEYSSKL